MRMRRQGIVRFGRNIERVTVPWLDGGKVDTDDLCTGELVSHSYCPRQQDSRISGSGEGWYVMDLPGTTASPQVQD